MFKGCASLTTAPELPATILATHCYSNMFYGCSKLNRIKMLATDISASNCLTDWVKAVSSTGTFVKHKNMTSLLGGVSGIPNGWTVVNNVEKNLITFTIGGVQYQAEEGMTWGEWVDSPFNTDGYTIFYNNITTIDLIYIVADVLASDIIVEGETYVLTIGGVGDDMPF